ncbi:MAG TPA: threonine/serine exporter family protein, partial [Streptosporangiaceae bacterium]
DGAPAFTQTVRVSPELARLDLVAECKFLVNRIIAGELRAAEADRELVTLERRDPPYPAWLRIIGVVLFATGFAPSVQATWREVFDSLVLGAVMGVLFIAAERIRGLRSVFPIIGPFVVGLVAFNVLNAHLAPGGPLVLMVPALFVLIIGGFFALTVGALALRGLATLNGDHYIEGLNDLRDAVSLTVALTLGLIVGAAPMLSHRGGARRRR